MKSCGAVLAFILLFGGCTTVVQTNPQRTAMEEMLLSTAAADRAAEKLTPQIPENAQLFVDNTNF